MRILQVSHAKFKFALKYLSKYSVTAHLTCYLVDNEEGIERMDLASQVPLWRESLHACLGTFRQSNIL